MTPNMITTPPKERQILFKGEMVRAILNSTKTCTRRLNGLKLINQNPSDFENSYLKIKTIRKNEVVVANFVDWKNQAHSIPCPYGKPLDRLWVKETWRPALSESHECFAYRADNKYQCGKQVPLDYYYKPTWNPSIFMPRKASRILLEITEIQVQKLKDISAKDAIAEGIEVKEESNYKDYLYDKVPFNCPIKSFRSLWESINGINSWEENPWVWTISFDVI